MDELPLAGIRVVDFTWIVAGPTATKVLADFGAQVIRIEHVDRVDSLRLSGVRPTQPPSYNESGAFNYFNRNKLSWQLNVRHPEGLALVKRLIAVSDVVVENFSSFVMESLGLSFAELQEVQPGIIYCSASGFGHSGPDRGFTTWGPTAQALSGLTLTSGLPGKTPAGWGYSYMDHLAGYQAAVAILMALHSRHRTGTGQQIDLSQVEGGMALLGPMFLDFSVNARSWRRPGMPPGNRAWHPEVAPHGAYPCSGTDRWIAIAVTTQAEWDALTEAMQSPPWTGEPKFATNDARLANQDELDGLIGSWTCQWDDYRLMHRLQEFGIRAGVVQKASDRFEKDPQLAARDWWHKLPHPTLGETDFDGVAPKLSATPGKLRHASPLLGEHNAYVCEEILGMSSEEFSRYSDMGVFI